MNPREKTLFIIFCIALGAAGLAVGLDLYIGRIDSLDREFGDLEKRARRVESEARREPSDSNAAIWGDPKTRFFPPGSLPEPLSFASRIETGIKDSGLALREFRVLESSSSAQWLQYRAEGRIEGWFQFVGRMTETDRKALFRTISIARKEGSRYAIAFEVGHAVQP